VRILITGASGFVGRHLCAELDGFHEVLRVDRGEGDLRVNGVADGIVGEAKPDVVVHLAAKVGRLFGEDDPAETILDNAGMTALVAKACGRHGARLVYASTSEVYGDQGEQTCVEVMSDRRGRVHNAYGLSKRWGEEAGWLYAPAGFTVLRLSMPYGPGLPWGRGRAAIINMLWQALTRAPIPVHRGAERCWTYVADTVRGVRAVLEHADEGVFNIGRDDNRVSMRAVAEMACDLTGASHDLIVEVDAPGNQTVVKRLSNARLRSLGWRPEVDLEEGMRMTLDWVKSEGQREQTQRIRAALA